MKKERMISQDIAKGIAIIIVVGVHSFQVTKIAGYILGVLVCYIMPFFLFMAGYNYRNKGYTPWQNIKMRTWQILKPFLIYSLGILVIMGAYFYIRGEATIPELLKSYFVFLISKWGAPLLGWDMPQVLFQRLLGPYWFLQFLMIANVFFYLLVDWAISSFKRLISCLILLSGVSVLLISAGIILPWGIQNAPAIAGVMILAAYMHKTDALFAEPSKKIWTWINCLVCLATIGLVQLNYNGAGCVGAGALGEVMGGPEVYMMFAMAVFGTYFLVNACKLIEKIPVVSKFLAWCGQRTMLILMIHLPIVHILKDIFGLEQRNAAESLFGETANPMEAVVYVLAVAIVCGLVLLQEKLVLKSRERKALKV